jgi:hypothetical protein
MNTVYFFIFNALLEFTPGGILKAGKSSHFIYPPGKPRIPHLLRCRGFAVKYCKLHPRRLRSPRRRDLGSGILDFCNVGVKKVKDEMKSHRDCREKYVLINSQIKLWLQFHTAHR